MNLEISEVHIRKYLPLENKTDLLKFLNPVTGFMVYDWTLYYKGEVIGRIFKKYGLYKFLEEYGIRWQDVVAKRLLPDDCVFVSKTHTLFIFEDISQRNAEIACRKLMGCDFVKKQYQKLLSRANIGVEYIYLLSDCFKKPEYRDVLDYVISARCRFFFGYIPLSILISQFQMKNN